MRNYIVAETIDGQVVKTRLEKEAAQKLYRKIRTAGGEASIYEDMCDVYLIDLFMIGGCDIKESDSHVISKSNTTINIVDIKNNSELLLDAIQKVKYQGWKLCAY